MGVYSTVKETIKDAVSIAQQSDNIQLYKSILDAYNAAIELMSENADLKERIKELEKEKAIREQIEFKDNEYWIKKDDGSKDGPFCTRCWDVHKNLVRLHSMGNGEYVCWFCPECNK